MNMQEEGQPTGPRVGRGALAIVLWILTFGLGLECIYILKEIFLLIYSALGGSVRDAERFALGMVCILAMGALAYVIISIEYHRKHFDTPQSWRFFARTLAVELSILALYYIL